MRRVQMSKWIYMNRCRTDLLELLCSMPRTHFYNGSDWLSCVGKKRDQSLCTIGSTSLSSFTFFLFWFQHERSWPTIGGCIHSIWTIWMETAHITFALKSDLTSPGLFGVLYQEDLGTNNNEVQRVFSSFALYQYQKQRPKSSARTN